MKRVLTSTAIAVLIFLLFDSTGSAQERPAANRFYLKAAGGYFFSVSPGQFPDVGPYPPRDQHDVFDPLSGETTTQSEKVLTGSYGEGFRGGISFGYNFNRYVALEATINYYQSRKNLMTRNITTVEGPGTEVGRIQSDGHVKAIDIAPSIVFNPGFEGFNPYMRFGFVVPVWGRLFIETDANRNTPVPGQVSTVVAQTAIQREEEIKPNPTFGFQGALGAAYPLSANFDLFLEAEYRNVPVRSKEKDITEYSEQTRVINTSNGQELNSQRRGLSDLSVAERNTRYVETLDQHSNTPTGTTGTVTHYKNDNAPSNDLKSYINIGGLGLNLGIRLRLP